MLTCSDNVTCRFWKTYRCGQLYTRTDQKLAKRVRKQVCCRDGWHLKIFKVGTISSFENNNLWYCDDGQNNHLLLSVSGSASASARSSRGSCPAPRPSVGEEEEEGEVPVPAITRASPETFHRLHPVRSEEGGCQASIKEERSECVVDCEGFGLFLFVFKNWYS